MLPKRPVPSTLAYIIVIFVNSAKLCLNQNMFLLSPNLPTAAAILFLCLSCQQLSSDWFSLVSIVFNQSGPICNLHRCYRNLNWCYVKVALVFSQSELCNFSTCIISKLIHSFD